MNVATAAVVVVMVVFLTIRRGVIAGGLLLELRPDLSEWAMIRFYASMEQDGTASVQPQGETTVSPAVCVCAQNNQVSAD